MKIGILTYHRSHNYGAYLQSYALAQKLLDETDNDVEIIDYNSSKAEKYYIKDIFRYKNISSIIFNLKKYKMFKHEVKKLPLSSNKIITDNLEVFKSKISNQYDLIIVGSDEIWKIGGFRGFPNVYWLPDIKNCKKMSYAASSRNEVNKLSEETKNQIIKYLTAFSYVTVRDEVTKNLIEAISEKKAMIVCDPTMAYQFHFDKNLGIKLLKEKFHIDVNKKVLGIMLNNKNLANKIINKYKDKYQIVSLFYNYPNTISNPNLTPFEWFQIIGVLDGFITNFFHGMCFALKGNTPFLIIEERSISNIKYSKSYDLLSRYHLEKNFVLNDHKNNLDNVITEFVDLYLDNNNIVDFNNIVKNESKSFNIFLNQLKKGCSSNE